MFQAPLIHRSQSPVSDLYLLNSLSDCSGRQNHLGGIQKTHIVVLPSVPISFLPKWPISIQLFLILALSTECQRWDWMLEAQIIPVSHDWETQCINGPQLCGSLVLMGSYSWFLLKEMRSQLSCICITCVYLLDQFLNAKCSWIMCHSENYGYVVHDALTILDGYQRGMFPPTECRTKNLFVCTGDELWDTGIKYKRRDIPISVIV